MSTKPVVVYGASGYTGRLVCEYLRELNVPFTAAGRDKDRIQAVMEKIPGIETADYDIAEVEHDVASLTDLFQGSQVVSNMAGPFIKFGGDAVEAALAAGCHYLDTTGEQDWLMESKSRWGKAFADKGLLLAPSIAQMYTTGEIAANICLETPGLDTLDILVLWKGFPTYASMQTIFTILKADHFYLEQNQYKQWAPTSTFEVAVPGQHSIALALPWGGTSHPVWFKDDPRVADVAGTVQASMPPRENPRLNTSLDSVYASGPLGRAHCVIHGNCNYKQSGLLQAYSAYSLLQQAPKRVGFASGCQAFGHRELLGILRSFGLVLEPELTVRN